MSSPSHSPPSTKSSFNEPENDNTSSPPLSPKRSFSFSDEDDDAVGSLGYFKRRHVHIESEAARRVPLDPLSASKIGNKPRLHEDPSLLESSFHTLGTTAKLRSSDGDHSTPTNSTAYLWSSAAISGNADRLIRSARYKPEVRESCDTFALGPALAWPPPSRCRSDISPLERRTSRWDDKVTQSIRSRSSSVPYMRHPPGDHWKAGLSSDELARTIYGLVDDCDSIFDSPPSPGFAKRRCSESDVTGHGSWSLSLALGSQPLRADESPKAIPPIGAERSKMVSTTPRRSRSLPPAELPSSNQDYRTHLRLKSDRSWRDGNNTHPLGHLCGAPDNYIPDPPITKDEFNRLLRHTVHNTHSSKVFSPLSPLRNPPPTFSLTTNPVYQRYLPSFTNKLSLRYTKRPNRRIRNLCDLYQPVVMELECTHCQECKRDTIGKRLLASRYRQKRKDAISLLTSPLTFDVGSPFGSSRGNTDEDGGSLRVAANSTSIGHLQASPRLQDLHDFGNDDEDYPEIPDEDLLSDEEDVVLGRREYLLKFD